MHRYLAAALFVVGVTAAILVACGGGGGTGPAVCGNGVQEGDEQCDLGAKNGMDGQPCTSTCRGQSVIRSSLNVTWSILTATGIEGFRSSSCSKIEADYAEVIVTGPDVRIEFTASCADYGRIISSVCTKPDGSTVEDCTRLPKGDYQATITLKRNSDHTAVTEEVTSPKRNIAKDGETVNISIDFGYNNLLNKGTLRGSLLIDVSWGEDKKTCTTATPPVTVETLYLIAPTALKPEMTKTVYGTPLDGIPGSCGMPPEPCCFVAGKPPNQNRFYEEAALLKIGEYVLKIKGYSGNSLVYCKKLPVFVGPSSNNEAFKILVPAVVAGDAGAALCE